MVMSYRIKEKRNHEEHGEVNTGQTSVIIPKLISLEHWMQIAGVETLNQHLNDSSLPCQSSIDKLYKVITFVP